MRVWQRAALISASILALALISVFLFLRRPLPEGSVPRRDVVSYCTGDATNDGVPELLLISGDGKTDTGERHGQLLLVCEGSAKADMIGPGYIPHEKIVYNIDLSGIKPMKVQLGDVNGDGILEVALCVYKTTKFYPEMDKRPFFFDLVEGNLIPVWLGSRLSRPFDDYILADIDDDAADEIISIERLEDGRRVLAVYNWRGFGFEMFTESAAFDGGLRFDPGASGQAADAKEIYAVFSNDGEQSQLVFRLNEDTLVYSEI